MKHGSLFSGIGGFDLAAEWMGWENVFHCEWDMFCKQILKYYWPNAKSYGNIDETDFTIWRGLIDILTGGFPCQPYSAAGKRQGKEDNRHKWPQMLRAIREIQPRWVVGENVPGLLNWQRGVVLDEIKADLEAAGFEVFPPLVLPACGKNAPHRRDRLFIIAYSNGSNGNISIQQRRQDQEKNLNTIWINPDNTGLGLQGGFNENRKQGTKYNDQFINGRNREWEQSTTEVATRLCRVDARVPNRMDRIKSLGNSVSPPLIYEIFKAIEQYERSTEGNI